MRFLAVLLILGMILSAFLPYAHASSSSPFGNCTSLPTGWNCGNTNGLTGSLATITNGIAYTNLYAQGAGGGNQFYYSTTQKGTFPWSPCQAPANGVLPSGLNRISATFNLTNFVPFGTYRYHIYIGLYYWLPNGAVTAGGIPIVAWTHNRASRISTESSAWLAQTTLTILAIVLGMTK